jgi:hypothetical protein
LPTATIEFHLNSSWATGYNAELRIVNTGNEPLYEWVLSMNRPMGLGANFQNGGLVAYQGQSETTIGFLDHNAPVPVGGSVSIWLYGTHSGVVPIPTDFRLTRAERRVIPTTDYSLDIRVHSEWNPGYLRHAIVLVNTTNRVIQGWEVEFDIIGGANIAAVDIGNVAQTTSSSALFTYTPGTHRSWHPGQELHLGMTGITTPGTTVSITNVVVYERVAVPYGGWEDWIPTPPNGNDNGDNGYNNGGNGYDDNDYPIEPQPTPHPMGMSMRDYTLDDIAVSELHEALMFVKGEIIISAELGAPFSELYNLFASHEGEIVGFLPMTNDYQVYFGRETTEAELWELVEIIDSHEMVILATLNLVSMSEVPEQPEVGVGEGMIGFAPFAANARSTDERLLFPIAAPELGSRYADHWADYRPWDAEISSAGRRNWAMQVIDAPLAWGLMRDMDSEPYSVTIGVIDRDRKSVV